MFRVVRCMPNGSCFYIAARLSLELLEIHKRLTLQESLPTTTVLDGQDSSVVDSAEDLRALICEWQHRGLQTQVPQLGFQDASSKRLFTRGDILALEKVRAGQDVDEKGPSRLRSIFEVLSEMKRERSWASTPEQIALAVLAKTNVNVQTRSNDGLVLRDRVQYTQLPNDGTDGTSNLSDDPSKGTDDTSNLRNDTSKDLSEIHLLFHNSHYDLLIHPAILGAIREKIPVKNMCSEIEMVVRGPKKDE